MLGSGYWFLCILIFSSNISRIKLLFSFTRNSLLLSSSIQISLILGNHSHDYHGSSTHSSYRHHNPSDGIRHSFSSVASASGGNDRHPNNSYNKETQRAILTALTKLQRDVNNILERLNRLETSSHFLQQV